MTDRSALDTISLVAAVIALYAVLRLELLSALLSGLLVAQLVQATVPVLNRLGIASNKLGKAIALILVAAIVSIAIALAVAAMWRLTTGPENLFLLLQRMAEVVDTARAHLPSWARQYLPNNMEEFETGVSKWFRDNAWQLRLVGRDVGVFLTQTIVGMIIGGMIAFTRDTRIGETGPLAAALEERVIVLSGAFRSVVFSQVRIAALNTLLTANYLALALPAFGIDLPFLKTMIAVTFIVGLLPIIGNLISNRHRASELQRVASLAFLIIIHKLEYLVNASPPAVVASAAQAPLIRQTSYPKGTGYPSCDDTPSGTRFQDHVERRLGGAMETCKAAAFHHLAC